MEAPLVGVLEEPSAPVYEEVLERQADLFGGITGLCAVASPDDAAPVQAAERVGQAFFAFEQLLLDGEQYSPGQDRSWNAWRLLSEDDVYELIGHWHDEFRSAIEEFPEEQRTRLRPLTAIDFEVWERRSLST